MGHKEIIDDLRESVGTKEPIEYFNKLTDLFQLLFERLDKTDASLSRLKVQTALSIKWEPKLASDLLVEQIKLLRKDKDTYFNELKLLKEAYEAGEVVKNYEDFCNLWIEVLGWHPFLDYQK